MRAEFKVTRLLIEHRVVLSRGAGRLWEGGGCSQLFGASVQDMHHQYSVYTVPAILALGSPSAQGPIPLTFEITWGVVKDQTALSC